MGIINIIVTLILVGHYLVVLIIDYMILGVFMSPVNTYLYHLAVYSSQLS